ncbi:MAG: HD domain-containing protein [Nanoarchaeota archaeon]
MAKKKPADYSTGIDEFPDDEYTYSTPRFRLTAKPENPLEVKIIQAIKNDPELQEKLEFEDCNAFHPEGAVGTHIEQGIKYARMMVARYRDWKRDEQLIISAYFLHDLCKADEEFFEYEREIRPEKHHALLAAEMSEILEILTIEDDSIAKLIRHHDVHYRLHRDSQYWKDDEVCRNFRFNFRGFSMQEMEALIRLGLVDRYRPKPKKKTKEEREVYNRNKRIYNKDMKWFIETAIRSALVDSKFKVFS